MTVADIGTGSGIIAITVAKERSGTAVTAVDISPKALEVARDNAKRLSADVRFIEGNVLDPFVNKETFDVVISNPPYISKDEMESLQDVVSGHDPHLALTDQGDGLSFYRRLIQAIPKVMKDQILAVFEIGHTQGQAVKDLFTESFPDTLVDVQIIKDINGKDRIATAFIARPDAKSVGF